MNQIQVLALLRQSLSILGGYLVGSGYLDAAQSETLIGAVVALAGVGWSIYASRKVGVINAASSISQVTSIEVSSPSIAAKTTSDKVTTAA